MQASAEFIYLKLKLLTNLVKYFLGCEAHGVDIVCPGGELISRSQHVLDGSSETVINVHHGEPGVGSEVAAVSLRGQSVVEDLDRVVSGATPGVGVVADDAGEAETSEVQVESLVVVFSQQLSVHLGHSVDGLGSLNTQVRSGVARRLGTKCSDSAGDKQLQFV